jgi:hypothetical protein
MAEYNITVNQHQDFARSFQLKEGGVVVDMTNYSVGGTLKKHHTSTDSVAFYGAITSAVDGLWTISLEDTVTATMAPGEWIYDVVMTRADGVKVRLLEGRAFVKAGVTV